MTHTTGTQRSREQEDAIRPFQKVNVRPLLPGSVSQYRKASCIAGSVNNVGQDEILHIGTGWLHPLDSDGP